MVQIDPLIGHHHGIKHGQGDGFSVPMRILEGIDDRFLRGGRALSDFLETRCRRLQDWRELLIRCDDMAR